MKQSQKGALIGLGIFSIYTAGVFGSGYAVRDCNQEETKSQETCYEMVKPLRIEFQNECAKKTLDTLYNGSLADIVHRRDAVCKSEESWRCEPIQPGYSGSDYKAEFR